MSKPEVLLDLWSRHGVRILYVQEVRRTPTRVQINVFAIRGGEITRLNKLLVKAGVGTISKTGRLIVHDTDANEDALADKCHAICAHASFKFIQMPL